MKNLLLYVIIFILIQIIMSCASSQEAVGYSYEKIDETKRDVNSSEVWAYRYSVGDGPWEEIKVYVVGLTNTWTIFVDIEPSTIGTSWRWRRADSRCFYDARKRGEPNFSSQTRAEQRSVKSLEEAIETALSWYIEDNKVRKQ